MGEIYANAEEVLVWLGPESWSSERLFSINRTVEELDSKLSETDALWTKSTLADLLNRPWFGRRWVIQEVALAKRAQLVSKQDSMGFDTFLDILSRLAMLIDYKDEKLEPLEMMRHLRESSRHPKGISADEHKLRYLRILESFRNTNCSDPRDRIYALGALGLKAFNHHVSYVSSVEDTYSNFAHKLIKAFELKPALQFKVLQYAYAFASAADSPLLSWVPDWRCTRRYHLLETDSEILDSRPLGTKHCSVINFFQDRRLLTNGTINGRISHTSSVCSQSLRFPVPIWGSNLGPEWIRSTASSLQVLWEMIQARVASWLPSGPHR